MVAKMKVRVLSLWDRFSLTLSSFISKEEIRFIRLADFIRIELDQPPSRVLILGL
jgi:hypothetical protein